MNINEYKSRKDYYSTEFNSERANAVLTWLISKCSFKEISWIYRNLVYDQVAYYDQNHKAKLYDGTYTDLNVEQANRFQQQISTVADLFEQSILNKREFDEDYLKQYEFAGPYLRIIRDKDKRIEQLEEAIAELNSKI